VVGGKLALQLGTSVRHDAVAVYKSDNHQQRPHVQPTHTTTLASNVAFYMDQLLVDWKVALILGFSLNYYKCDNGCGRDVATGSFRAYGVERMESFTVVQYECA
jgi:hypothetical protein